MEAGRVLKWVLVENNDLEDEVFEILDPVFGPPKKKSK